MLVSIDPSRDETVKISLSKIVPPIDPPEDTRYIKHVRLQSKLLSEFWGRPMYLGAVVLLPDGFEEHPEARYPVLYWQDHFAASFDAGSGGFHETPPGPELSGRERLNAEYAHRFYRDWTSGKLPRMLIVSTQHANPYYDDSYGVNSANIGPYGDAIVQELIPYVEKKFRAIGEPWARALYGGSTGGWIALAQQIFYPDFFNGSWCFCPDPGYLRRPQRVLGRRRVEARAPHRSS
jgi:enterochelin esterase-like enzyme